MPAQLQQKANPAHQRQGWLFVCYGITVGRFLYLPKICFYKNDRCNWEFWQRIGQPYARNLGRCFVAAVDILSLPICVRRFRLAWMFSVKDYMVGLSYLCLSFSGSGHQLDCFPRHGLRPTRIKQSALLTIPIQNFGKG